MSAVAQCWEVEADGRRTLLDPSECPVPPDAIGLMVTFYSIALVLCIAAVIGFTIGRFGDRLNDRTRGVFVAMYAAGALVYVGLIGSVFVRSL